MSFHWNLADTFRGKQRDIHANASEMDRSFNLSGVRIGAQEVDVVIRLVQSLCKVEAACELVNRRYAWRGYGAAHSIPIGKHHATFTAELDGNIVGTITLAVDSAKGLAIDSTFAHDMTEFRNVPNAKICELTKFAFSSNVQSKEIMAALFHAVFIYGRSTYHCTDLFIEVNPRHVRFYQSMLNFQPVGPLRRNEAVEAPSQLMRLPVAAIQEHITRSAGEKDQASRSLYPYFLRSAEERQLRAALMGSQAEAIGRRQAAIEGAMPRLPKQHRVRFRLGDLLARQFLGSGKQATAHLAH